MQIQARLPYLNTIHLYRHLLRATSYLIDPHAVTYFKEYISSAFHQHVKSTRSPKSYKDHDLPTSFDLNRLKRGRRLLSLLERANLGHKDPLERVLALTYARVGSRRRDSMSKIMQQDGTQSLRDRDWTPPKAFEAIRGVQEHLQHHVGGKRLKGHPGVPQKNNQKLPFPDCRLPLVHKKWYIPIASELLPPLQKDEWQRVYNLAVGKVRLTHARQIQRRTVANVHVFTTPSDALLFDDILGDQSHGADPHKLTKRYIRRRFEASVLSRAPCLHSTLEDDKPVLRWELGTTSPTAAILKESSQRAALFD